MQIPESEDKRIFARFPVNLSIRFLDLLTNQEGKAQAVDISAKGVGFTTDTALRAFTPLEMWIHVPDKGEPLYTRGEVVWSEMIGPQTYRTGVNLERADLMGMSRLLRSKQQ
ncbi:MAG: PilZ domain-containing protein [Candidatus Omnitrophica bacterium]|nr:PilZ domain-containing protein [Candidatus Omnitrophota bacterium]